jgi:hypothetical protein
MPNVAALSREDKIFMPSPWHGVERLLEGKFCLPDASAPGFIFDAEVLASLGPDKSAFKIVPV